MCLLTWLFCRIKAFLYLLRCFTLGFLCSFFLIGSIPLLRAISKVIALFLLVSGFLNSTVCSFLDANNFPFLFWTDCSSMSSLQTTDNNYTRLRGLWSSMDKTIYLVEQWHLSSNKMVMGVIVHFFPQVKQCIQTVTGQQ